VWADHLAVTALVALATWILLSGLDDLFIGLVFCIQGRKRMPLPSDSELAQAPERGMAVLVPLWKEHRVIGRMLERNLSVVRYTNYHVFVGVYPNDEATIRAVKEIARRHPNVHVATCPHNGPTSKGDCLNWIYRGMQKFEGLCGIRFEVITTHDAEDLIHADSLRLINWFSRDYAMVQVPVLPLPTALAEITHGIYCDEFAEFQSKDIPVRQRLGGFLPSNGVGTGYERDALEKLAAQRGGRIFDPDCLTEDYENGYRLHELGCRQIFVPLHFESGVPVATREYFPRNLKAAIRQRSRWVAGIALQGWQLHGWRAPWPQVYWFWRDRKGVVGNLLAPFTNVLFLYGLVSWALAARHGEFWHLARFLPEWLAVCYAATLWISIMQAALRAWCCSRIYGWRFAAGVPIRMLWGNIVNSAATAGALRQFWKARQKQHSLKWLKTDHSYPSQTVHEQGRARVGEILVKMRAVSMEEIEEALQSRPAAVRIGEHLVFSQRITEEHLYQALSSQSGIPFGLPPAAEISRLATRVLPSAAARRWKVLPYRVAAGQLHVLTPEVPSSEMVRDLAAITSLELRFRLVRPEQFEALASEYLPATA
jgi:adsorption protein B